MLLDLALECRAGREHGLELEVGERLEAIETRRGEQAAERDLDVPVFLAQRQHLFPQEDARREPRQDRTVRLDVFQSRVGQPVLAGQPLQHVFLRRGGIAVQTPERVRIYRGELMALDHALGERGARIGVGGNGGDGGGFDHGRKGRAGGMPALQ